MQAALDAVKNGESASLRAARENGVSRQTLSDRVSGKVVHGTKPGPKPLLSKAEETELSNFLLDVAKAGYGKSRKQVKNLAEAVARDKGRLTTTKKLTDGWFRRFMARQPHLSMRKGDPTANVRMDCLIKETMDEYFQLLKDTLIENDLMDFPNQIYNVDETGMPLDHHAPKIVAGRGHKKVRYRTSGNKSQVTVIGCVSACGQAIPPFVIFDAKSLNKEWTKGEVPGSTYGMSSKGWVDTELFRDWLTDHFVQFAVGARPLLLLLDGHSSHYQPELVRFAKEHDIISFCLPPHTTHESQPLDATVFKPLKQNWQDACHDYIQSHPGKAITKYQFSALLRVAWEKTMTPTIICSGFRKCGVYPFNPCAINCSISRDNPDASLTVNRGENETENEKPEDGENSDEQENDKNKTFSEEQEQLYQMRYEEGYDLMDPQYLQWLEIHHPDSVPADKDMFVPAPDPTEDLNQQSLTDMFSFVPPSSPVTMNETEALTGDSHTLSLTSPAGSPPPLSPHRSHTHSDSHTLDSAVNRKSPSTPGLTPESTSALGSTNTPELTSTTE